eukprot:g965.t1
MRRKEKRKPSEEDRKTSSQDMSLILERISKGARQLEVVTAENVSLAGDIEGRVEQLNELLARSFAGDEDMLEEFRAAKKVADLVLTNTELCEENDELRQDLNSFQSILTKFAEKQKDVRSSGSEKDAEETSTTREDVQRLVRENQRLEYELRGANTKVQKMGDVLKAASKAEEENMLVQEAYVAALQKENEGLRALLADLDEEEGDGGSANGYNAYADLMEDANAFVSELDKDDGDDKCFSGRDDNEKRKDKEISHGLEGILKMKVPREEIVDDNKTQLDIFEIIGKGLEKVHSSVRSTVDKFLAKNTHVFWKPSYDIIKSLQYICPFKDAIVDGRYKIIYHRGTGGYKTVYKALDLKDDKYVALALFRKPSKEECGDVETAEKEMKREFKTTEKLLEKRLVHKNILRIFGKSKEGRPAPIILRDPTATNVREGKGADIVSRVHYIAMDLAEIEVNKLAKFEQRGTSKARVKVIFTEKLARFFMKELMGALQFLHKKKIYHRDIKGDNVMLCKTEYASSTVNKEGKQKDELSYSFKLLDFGFLDMTEETKCSSSSNRPENYWPPEGREKGKKYDGGPVDMYQSGILLCRLISPKAERQLSRKGDLEGKYRGRHLYDGKEKEGVEKFDVEKLLEIMESDEEMVVGTRYAAADDGESKSGKTTQRHRIMPNALKKFIRALLAENPEDRPSFVGKNSRSRAPSKNECDEASKSDAEKNQNPMHFDWMKSNDIDEKGLVNELSARMALGSNSFAINWNKYVSGKKVIDKICDIICRADVGILGHDVIKDMDKWKEKIFERSDEDNYQMTVLIPSNVPSNDDIMVKCKVSWKSGKKFYKNCVLEDEGENDSEYLILYPDEKGEYPDPDNNRKRVSADMIRFTDDDKTEKIARLIALKDNECDDDSDNYKRIRANRTKFQARRPPAIVSCCNEDDCLETLVEFTWSNGKDVNQWFEFVAKIPTLVKEAFMDKFDAQKEFGSACTALLKKIHITLLSGYIFKTKPKRGKRTTATAGEAVVAALGRMLAAKRYLVTVSSDEKLKESLLFIDRALQQSGALKKGSDILDFLGDAKLPESTDLNVYGALQITSAHRPGFCNIFADQDGSPMSQGAAENAIVQLVQNTDANDLPHGIELWLKCMRKLRRREAYIGIEKGEGPMYLKDVADQDGGIRNRMLLLYNVVVQMLRKMFPKDSIHKPDGFDSEWLQNNIVRFLPYDTQQLQGVKHIPVTPTWTYVCSTAEKEEFYEDGRKICFDLLKSLRICVLDGYVLKHFKGGYITIDPPKQITIRFVKLLSYYRYISKIPGDTFQKGVHEKQFEDIKRLFDPQKLKMAAYPKSWKDESEGWDLVEIDEIDSSSTWMLSSDMKQAAKSLLTVGYDEMKELDERSDNCPLFPEGGVYCKRCKKLEERIDRISKECRKYDTTKANLAKKFDDAADYVSKRPSLECVTKLFNDILSIQMGDLDIYEIKPKDGIDMIRMRSCPLRSRLIAMHNAILRFHDTLYINEEAKIEDKKISHADKGHFFRCIPTLKSELGKAVSENTEEVLFSPRVKRKIKRSISGLSVSPTLMLRRAKSSPA